MPILTEDFRACGEQVISLDWKPTPRFTMAAQIAPDNHEGIRVSTGKTELAT